MGHSWRDTRLGLCEGIAKFEIRSALNAEKASRILAAGGRLRGGRAAAPPNPTAERPGPRWFGCAGSPRAGRLTGPDTSVSDFRT